MKRQMWTHQVRPVIDIPRVRSLDMPRLPAFLPPMMLLLVLAALVWAGLQQLATPAVVPATAPATEFSGERAMENLRVIAAAPRAVGSPGHVATRTYLVEQLEALGLSPDVQTATVLVPGEEGEEGFAAATVYNVVARLPGTDSTGAIVLNAHYDSGGTGSGAMDAGSGVVTILEAVRAIQAGPELRNDLIIVFADAEEVGMLGAAAFTGQHPWAKDVRLAFNYEGAGGSGPALLYSTSDEDNWLVSEFLKVAPHPSASSLLAGIDDLYAAGRLDCDLGEYTAIGSAGLGFVVLGDTPVYHTVLDNPDQIDPGSIQQEGVNTLAAVRHFGDLDLSAMPRSGSSVFFNLWPDVVAHYPAAWVVPLAALITALIAGMAVTGVRRGAVRVRGLIGGAVVFLLGSIGTAIIATLLWIVIRMLNADYQVMLIGSYQASLYVVALSMTTVAILTALYIWLGIRMRPDHLMMGVLVGSLLPLWIVSLAVPGMSYLVTWPLLFATFPLLWRIPPKEGISRPWARVLVLSIAAVPILILLPGTLHGMMGLVNRLEGLSGTGLLGVLMLFVSPVVGLLLPHLYFLTGTPGESRLRRWVLPASAAVAALALIAWGSMTSGFDTQQPRPNQIAYHVNADTGAAEWVSFDRHLDDWTGQFFPAGTESTEFESILLGTRPAYVAPAPAATIADSPAVTVVSDATSGQVRTLVLRLMSPQGARLMAAEIQAVGEVVGLAVNGRSVDLTGLEWASEGSFPLIYHNPPPEGWTLTLAVRTPEAIVIQVEESDDGLPDVPGLQITPRSADMMPAPGYARDPTIVSRTFTF